MKKKILIIGSNFAATHHLKIIKQTYKNYLVDLCSPNIHKKKINFKLQKYTNYKNLLNLNNYFLIVCCSTPSVQNDLIKYFLKEKIICNNLILEKPVSNKISNFKKFLIYVKKKNIKLVVNYTYSNLRILKIIKKKFIYTRKKYLLNLFLAFKHPFFIKKNNSWKNFISEGGGVVNYYLNHILFSLIDIFGNLEIISLKSRRNPKNELKEFDLILLGKRIAINMKINLCTNNYVHAYELHGNNEKIKFNTKSKNWYKKYNYYEIKNKKNYLKKIIYENIFSLIKNNYDFLNNKKNISLYANYLNKILLTEILCHKLNRKLKKYDFKKL